MVESARISACYMAGVLQALYDSGDITEDTKKCINEKLEEDGLENVRIE